MFLSKLSLDWYNYNIYSILFQNIYLLQFCCCYCYKEDKIYIFSETDFVLKKKGFR